MAAAASLAPHSPASALTLDPAIRNWVLVPISLAMFLIGVIRHHATKLMAPKPRKVELGAVRESQAVMRSGRLRANHHWISREASFRMRRSFFNEKGSGVFQQKVASKNPQAEMMSDPSMMQDMMAKNLGMIIPQSLTFMWVSFFFSGFVMAKTPFPLTQRFRVMLQRGIDVGSGSMDVTYVSSLSWYFLNMFGMRGLFTLVLGEGNAVDDTALMQQQMEQAGAGMDKANAFVAERENLELIEAKDGAVYAGAEERALKVLKRSLRAS